VDIGEFIPIIEIKVNGVWLNKLQEEHLSIKECFPPKRMLLKSTY